MKAVFIGYKCLLCGKVVPGYRTDLWQHIDGYHRDEIMDEWATMAHEDNLKSGEKS